MRWWILSLSAGCVSDEYTRLYFTRDKAESLDWDAIGNLDHLGPTLVDDGVNFGVYAEHAERIEVLLFDDPESDRPTQQFPLTRYGDVWNLYIEGIGPGQHYGLVAWGPNWTYDESFHPGSTAGFHADVDEDGNRYNPNKLLIDPYAKVVHRDHDWSRGSAASGPHLDQSTWGAAAKGVVIDSTYVWGDDAWRAARQSGAHEGHGEADLVIYEVHPKGFSMSATSNQWGVEHFGTFRGLGEGASYFSDLGITAVELMPVHEKPLDGGYWGYNNLSWFAPEVTYSAAWQDGAEPVEIVDEFKGMVDALHAQGIEVIVDVVYNHTGEGGLWRTKLFFDDPDGDWQCDPAVAVNLDSQEVSSLMSWRGIDSASNYVLESAGQGFYDGSTGVGNQVRANHTPAQRQILDSLRYMVEELHVDGFRFDLAAVLGEPDGSAGQYWTTPTDTTLNLIADDPVLQRYDTRIIAEPWSTAYDGSTRYPMSQDDPAIGWGEWNAVFRDWWRSFLTNDDWALNARQGDVDGGGTMTASRDRYESSGKQPYHSVNFVTAHDGFTMFDLFSYPEKENGCGPLNPICCEDACSAWCDPTSGESNNHSRNWGQGGDESLKRQMIRNAFTGLMLSQGTPMMLGGDEWMRTQYGNNNAYTTWSDNEWAWFRWGEWTSENRNNVFRHRNHDFVRQIIALRKRHPAAFAPDGWDDGAPIEWLSETGAPADDGTWGSRHIARVHRGDDPIALLINLEQGPVTFALPGGANWGVVVDTQAYFDLPGRSGEPSGWFDENPDADPFRTMNARIDDPLPVDGSYTVQPRSIVVLESL